MLQSLVVFSFTLYPTADLCHCFRMRHRGSYYETSVSDRDLSACLIRPASSCCIRSWCTYALRFSKSDLHSQQRRRIENIST